MTEKSFRPTWDQYFKEIVQATATRSPCERLHVGCVLVKDNRIISQGYNGFLPGLDHISIVRDDHEPPCSCVRDPVKSGHEPPCSCVRDPVKSGHEPPCSCVRDPVKSGHEQATVHAEQNAIADCARRGVSCEGCCAYITHYPCIICCRLMLAAGIKEIKYINDYRNDPLVEYFCGKMSCRLSQI